MLLRDTIDELDGLIAELSQLRQSLCRAELSGLAPAAAEPVDPAGQEAVDNALWDAEAGLRRVARRTEARAQTVRRAIELRLAEETRRADPDDRATA